MPVDPETSDTLQKLRKAIASLTAAQADILAKRLSAAFVLGYRKSGTKETPELQRQAIQKITAEQLGYIAEVNEALGRQLEGRVRDSITEGKGYTEIRKEMVPFIEETFGSGGMVTIDRTGQTRKIIIVDAYGNLSQVQKPITKPYQASLETYSDMLSRTATHAAYARGRAEGYKSQGMRKWRYVAMQDERVRAAHLALHGKIFEIGSSEEELALQVMSEPNCRCRQIPYFDNVELDTPDSKYQAQKEKWGLKFENGEWVFAEAGAE